MKTSSRSRVWRWRSSSPAPSAPPPPRRKNRAAPSSTKPAKACCGCCRPTPSPNIPSTPSKGKLAYTATAGTLAFYDQSGEQSAAVFYTAYVAKDAGANRPLTFVFNGGPGAASAFLHLGLVGPRILDLGPDGRDAARAELRDNPDTWLSFTDLVLIDPIGTGWSRAVKPDDAKHFWSIRSDADVIAKAIALYVAKNNRAASPKYLFGESYGGFRAAKVARALQRDQGIVDLRHRDAVAACWKAGSPSATTSPRCARRLQLPSLAAAELERKNAFSRAALAAAEKFAMTDYLVTHGRRAAAGRRGERVLRPRGANDRAAGGRGDAGARLRRRRLREKPASATARSSAATTRVSRSTIPIPS